MTDTGKLTWKRDPGTTAGPKDYTAKTGPKMRDRYYIRPEGFEYRLTMPGLTVHDGKLYPTVIDAQRAADAHWEKIQAAQAANEATDAERLSEVAEAAPCVFTQDMAESAQDREYDVQTQAELALTAYDALVALGHPSEEAATFVVKVTSQEVDLKVAELAQTWPWSAAAERAMAREITEG